QLEHHVGKSALGVYAALSYVAYMGQTVTGALSQSASPRLARYFAEGNIEAFKRLLRILLLIAVGLGSALLLLMVIGGQSIVTLLYSSDFAEQHDVTVLLTTATALLFSLSMLGTAVTSMRQFRSQVVVQLVNLLIVTGASGYLVSSHGLLGAALTMLIGAGVLCSGFVLLDR